METLICEKCSKQWTRELTRGRKPRVCPECFFSSGVIATATLGRKMNQENVLPQADNFSVKFPAPSKWVCPSCETKVEVGVNMDYEPVHACKKRMKKVYPLDLVS